MSFEKWCAAISLCFQIWAGRSWLPCDSTHFYGEELGANLSSNGTALLISISWRLTWNTKKQPNSEKLFTCVSGLGSPCAKGSTNILMEPQTANCKSTVTSIDSFQYVPWTGLSTVLYYPLNATSTNYSTIGLTFEDQAWGLVTDFHESGYFGGQLIVMTSRRTDNKDFNSTPWSPVAAVVVMFPGCGGFNFTIPTVDPDGDTVWCRWSTTTAECNRCCKSSYGAPYPFNLSSDCVLTYTGGLVTSKVYYAVCIQLEDYYVNDAANYVAALIADNGTNITATPPHRLSSASLQFVVEISPNLNPCVDISPLINDKCSLGIVGLISCQKSILTVVPHAIVYAGFDNSVNSTIELNCTDGYYPNPSNLSVTCVQASDTAGEWVAYGQCSRMRSLNIFGNT